MRILYVDQFSSMGGAQRCFAELLPAFEQQGWQVRGALPGRGPMTDRVPCTSIPCGPYQSGAKSRSDILRFGLDIIRQTLTLSGLMRNCDLIYVNGPRVLPAAVLANHGRLPLLFHLHNFLDQTSSATLARTCARKGQVSVVACSEFVAAPMRPMAPRVIINGTPDMGFTQRNFTKPLRIGIIGRIEDQKGQLEFVQAARSLSDASFAIFGEPTDPAYHARVKALAHGLPVEFPGWTDDMPAVYRSLDLLVIASKQEGQSRVMLEAFSAGVLVVAFAAGGVVEAIKDNETGFLVPPASPDALAQRIRDLIKGPVSQLSNVAANARQAWEESYNFRLFQQRMIQAVGEIAARR